MKEGKSITKEELVKIIAGLNEVFDIVRVVDPYETNVLSNQLKQSQSEPCYGVWEKPQRCSNCISLKACTEFERKTKFEFRNDSAFYVISMPFKISDENDRQITVEMVNQVTDEMQVKTFGNEIIARTMNEFDNKLYVDSLTGVYNRRYFDDYRFIYANGGVLSRKVAFVYWDVTKFKSINDTYGHKAGDVALKSLAEVMSRYSRNSDSVIRMGGDEFMIVMQECDEFGIHKAIERIQSHIAELRLPELDGNGFDVNVGYAYSDHFTADKNEIREMVEKADSAMYTDKIGKR